MENKITEVAYIEAITAAAAKGNELAMAELIRIGGIVFPHKSGVAVKSAVKKPTKKKPAKKIAAKIAVEPPAEPPMKPTNKKRAQKKPSALTKKRNAAIENFKKKKPQNSHQRTLQELIDEVTGMQ